MVAWGALITVSALSIRSKIKLEKCDHCQIYLNLDKEVCLFIVYMKAFRIANWVIYELLSNFVRGPNFEWKVMFYSDLVRSYFNKIFILFTLFVKLNDKSY